MADNQLTENDEDEFEIIEGEEPVQEPVQEDADDDDDDDDDDVDLSFLSDLGIDTPPTK